MHYNYLFLCPGVDAKDTLLRRQRDRRHYDSAFRP